MRLLLDMNVTQRWAPELAKAGHEVVHWRDVGDRQATDREILAWAFERGYVVLTHDLDFGDILATTGGEGPSVVQIRSDSLSAELIVGPLIRGLDAAAEAIAMGALVSIDARSARVRLLPLRRR